ncbi:ATP-binding protein [Shewanella waksmanii]|uniref:ATP-binding protein n=1 Tax=Shewanella waksmanii TaxID=213783 RepID=UPI003734C8F3
MSTTTSKATSKKVSKGAGQAASAPALLTKLGIRSLRLRLLGSALILTLVLLPIIGVTLNNAFRDYVSQAAENELSAYLYSVLAVTDVDNHSLFVPELLTETRFNVIQSGLYALISSPIDATNSLSGPVNVTLNPNQQLLWQSNSYSGLNAPASLPSPAIGQNSFRQISINDKPFLVYSLSVSFLQKNSLKESAKVTLHVLKERAEFQLQIEKFSRQLWTWMLILMAVLFIVQLSWLTWTLRPLARFRHELTEVEQGHSQQISGQYPTEINAVAKQLNTLLTAEQRQRSRYRNALADLAHSLKTPLAVIRSQKGLSASSAEQVNHIDQIISYQLKRAKSVANNAWHIGIKVSDVSDKLVRNLPKIYPHVQLNYQQRPTDDVLFYGDNSDLTEVLGNLLDNACKAAKQSVMLSINVDQEQGLTLVVEDDGNGISESARQKILQRGIRADTYEQGHGIGLAIVRDICHSYDATLTIGQSPSLGGAAFTLYFPKTSHPH